MKRWLYPLGTVAGLVVIWQVCVIAFQIPAYLMPTPVAVVQRMFVDWHFLLHHTWVTTYETLGGFFLSVIIGIPLAVALVWSRSLEQAIMPLLVLSQTFPKVAIAPLLIIWFGLGVFPKLLVSFLVAFFPVVISGVTGMRSVETEMLELVHSMRATQLQAFWKVRFPHALPHIFSGMKVAVSFAIVGAVVGEWVGADRGLGYLLLWANAHLDTSMLFAVLVMLMVIGMVLYYSIVWLERWLLPWHVSMREDGVQVTI